MAPIGLELDNWMTGFQCSQLESERAAALPTRAATSQGVSDQPVDLLIYFSWSVINR